MTTFIRISTICTLISCISLGCTRPTEESAASVDDWAIPYWMDASDPEIAREREHMVKELQAKVDTGKLDVEGYQHELLEVPEKVIRQITDTRLRDLSSLLENEGRQIKLALMDLNDEIQSYIRAKGLYSLEDLEGTPEWSTLEKLSLDRLEARIEIRMAEEEIDSRPSPADTSANTQIQMPTRITELKKRLAAMDAEYELLDDLMRDRCSDASLLQHFLATQSSLQEMREENQRAQSRIRIIQLAPSGTENLLSTILNE